MSAHPLILAGLLRIVSTSDSPAVKYAAADLSADCGRVFGVPAHLQASGSGEINISIDKTLPGPEAWSVHVDPHGVTITGSDPLGLVYGIYQFSRRSLGVDPLWFWKGVSPEHRDRLELRAASFSSKMSAFRYRGWFINDEDLLSDFGPTHGIRTVDYPFYGHVMDPAIADRVDEAILRLGGNLVIPSSLVNVMNPPEAELVRHAAERGLYVTQHHIEPLGVSLFSFDSFWREQGKPRPFRYSTDPTSARQAWTAYVKKWHELAGDHVIWQLGLRGKGDRPVWTADSGISPATAGTFISQAIADQWEIIKKFDGRPEPVATTTLWSEGSELMAEGKLKLPPGVIVVYSDNGHTGEMGQDFKAQVRGAETKGGLYYHAGFWVAGAHLVQGVPAEQIFSVVTEATRRADDTLAIINVSNIREHVLAADIFLRACEDGERTTLPSLLNEFEPAALEPARKAFDAALPRGNDGSLIRDGDLSLVMGQYLAYRTHHSPAEKIALLAYASPATLEAAAENLDRVPLTIKWSSLEPRWRDFANQFYATQARFLATLYRMAAAVITTPDGDLGAYQAKTFLEEALRIRQERAQGTWASWYLGDKKEDWEKVLHRLEASGERAR